MEFHSEEETIRSRERTYAPPEGINGESASGHAGFDSLLHDLQWLEACIERRLNEISGDNFYDVPDERILLPDITEATDPYAQLVHKYQLDASDRLLLVAGLAPQVSPDLFNRRLINTERNYHNQYAQMGGYVDKNYLKFIPTIATIIHLLGGSERGLSLRNQVRLRKASPLLKEQIVEFQTSQRPDQPGDFMSMTVTVASEYVRYVLTGEAPQPDFGSDFPATLLRSNSNWDSLILAEPVMKKVHRLLRWMEYSPALLADNVDKINPSFPCLFYGPPGTGKTLTAKLIGHKFQKPVFRVNLPAIVSKWVGETEKNLAKLFDRAEGKDWILFFDEADAIFGKRTEIRESNDKWANLEVAYLLQRIEEYPGLVILSSNLKENMDKALTRRFQLVIEFPRPGKDEQLKLWKSQLPNGFTYREDIDFKKFLPQQLTGANIANILKIACLDALSSGRRVLTPSNLKGALQEELAKENRTM